MLSSWAISRLTYVHSSLIMAAVRSPRISAGWGLVSAAILILACGLTPSIEPTLPPSSTPTATASPTPPPTATPQPSAHIDAAEQALFYGDWESAEMEFELARAESPDDEVIARAYLGLAKTFLYQNRPLEAIPYLTQFVEGYPLHDRVGQGYFLRARAHLDLGNPAEAAEDYQSYLRLRAGVIDSYVEEWLGDTLRQADRPLEAVEHYQAAARLPRLESATLLKLKQGQAYLDAGEPTAAVTLMNELQPTLTDPYSKASVNYLAGQALEALGSYEAAYARYLDSVEQYPEAYDTYLGLIRLVGAGVTVDEFLRGFIDYSAGAYEQALAAFDRHLSVEETARGYYYRGLTRLELDDSLGALADFDTVVERFIGDPVWGEAALAKARTEWAWLGRYSAAIETYLRFVAELPLSSSAPEALFAAGRTAERIQELDRAATFWLRLPAEYPDSPLAFQGAFQAGIARYRSGDLVASRDAMLLANAIAGSTAELAASYLWEGKTHFAEGDLPAAEEAWRKAAAADPTGYYSVRADDFLLGRDPFNWGGSFHFSVDIEAERQEAETWLRETFSITSEGPLSEMDASLAGDRRMIRGLELWDLGLADEARAEFESLRSAVDDDAEATYRLMHQLLDLGFYRSAIFAARHVLRLAGMDDAATMQAPVYFNRIRFGAYFADLILPEAARQGFDGLFLLSVVRQESLFEGFATSYAAARGLMQVIPSTGLSIADQLGWPPGYTDADLYRPVVSVRFGAHYLAAQRDRFEGDLYAALSAYNAGPGNAILWKELAPEDPDLYLEVIRLQQPQLYIRTIYEVYAIYRTLYGAP